MPIELEKAEHAQLLASVQKYCREELEVEVNELRGRLLLDFLLEEVAPLGYNRGVRDAEAFLRSRLDDLAGSCFEPELTYWVNKPKR